MVIITAIITNKVATITHKHIDYYNVSILGLFIRVAFTDVEELMIAFDFDNKDHNHCVVHLRWECPKLSSKSPTKTC